MVLLIVAIWLSQRRKRNITSLGFHQSENGCDFNFWGMVKAMGGTVNEKERNRGMGNDVCYKIYSAFKKLFDM